MSNDAQSVSAWVGAFCAGIATLAHLVTMVSPFIWWDSFDWDADGHQGKRKLFTYLRDFYYKIQILLENFIKTS